MTHLTFGVLVFVGIGVFFLFIHMLMGKAIRPAKPVPEKLTIYECGEPTVGSAWVQFDVRYYVVALLFVIFDVEVAFFFPWAVVFGTANNLAKAPDAEVQAQLVKRLDTGLPPLTPPVADAEDAKAEGLEPATAKRWAMIALVDILVFFGVLMVGFAYLWKRGDLDWVRTTIAEREPILEGLPQDKELINV